MKLCIDCKWFRPAVSLDKDDADEFGVCVGPHIRVDRATGKKSKEFASLQRHGFYSLWGLCGCGPAGWHWAPRAGFNEVTGHAEQSPP